MHCHQSCESLKASRGAWANSTTLVRNLSSVGAPHVPQRRTNKRQRTETFRVQATETEDKEKPNPGLGLKAVWIGAENFGKVIGLTKKKEESSSEKPLKKMSKAEVIQSIRDDYSVNYFVSGKGDMEAYDPQCLFADPFAGFNGVQRFKDNVSNLGGLMEDVQLDLLDFQEEGNEVRTKWRFNALLQLPWRPRLAAAGGTKHVLDQDSGRVIKHIESWDVEPSKVIKQLLRPASKVPGSKAERFMLALSQGDARNMWLSSADASLLASSPVALVAVLLRTVTGQGIPGGALGGFLEVLAYTTLTAAILAKVYTGVSND